MAYFKDSYKTTRDGGVEYSYDGNWSSGPLVVDGTVTVTTEVGDWTTAVKRLVETSIEHRIGVD